MIKSKEALERIRTGCSPKKYPYINYTQSSIPFNEDLDAIKKDLDVLEYLKKSDKHKELYAVIALNGAISGEITFEQAEEVKEWLEYDEQNHKENIKKT